MNYIMGYYSCPAAWHHSLWFYFSHQFLKLCLQLFLLRRQSVYVCHQLFEVAFRRRCDCDGVRYLRTLYRYL